MSKVRINDLARELEVKSKAILDVLQEVGITEKKTHSSSLEDHEADKVRAHFRASGEGQSASKAARSARPDPDGIKTKIDLSHISKPGDVLKAIISKQQAAAPPPIAAHVAWRAGHLVNAPNDHVRSPSFRVRPFRSAALSSVGDHLPRPCLHDAARARGIRGHAALPFRALG